MNQLSRTIFVSEPDVNNRHHRGGLYEFKRDDLFDDEIFCCNGEEAQVRKFANAILDRVSDPEVLNLIYEYGEARVEVEKGDRADDDAGEGL